MKHVNPIKFFALCALFLNLGLTSVKAQSQSNLQKLEGTKWKASASFLTPPDTWLWEFNYLIEKNNKIRAHIVVAVRGFRQRLDYNMTTKSYETVNELTTVVERELNEVGTYQQTGNSIKMKFPSHQIDAKLDGSQMVGKIIAYDGEKSVWSAEVVSEKLSVTSKNNADGAKRKSESDGGAGISNDLSDLNPGWYLFNYEAQASGTYKIGGFLGNQSGVIKIEMDIRDTNNLKANFAFLSLSGELSGKIDSSKRLQLNGIGILKGSMSETKYQCSISALVENSNLTDGKYYCVVGYDEIKGNFEMATRKNK